MTYKQILVDNTTCSRRFHITFDDAAEAVPRVEVRCQFCNVLVFAEENHPPVKLTREENLTKTSSLSELLVSDCAFEDQMSQRTIPQYKGKDAHIYPTHVPGAPVPAVPPVRAK